MRKYDPSIEPDPAEWLELDELERVDLVSDYHRDAGFVLPNLNLHAMLHVVVENQLAEGYEAVARKLAQLQEEGLDRHDAIHAIASVLAGIVFHGMRAELRGEAGEAYFAGLEKLTAKRWLESAE